MLALLADELARIEIDLLLQENPGGITRIATSKFYTYHLEGDDFLFSDERRAEIEQALGARLVPKVYAPKYALETALSVPEPQRSDLVTFLAAWRSNAPAARP
jgi:hypothetical protein